MQQLQNWSVNTHESFRLSTDMVRLPGIGLFHISESKETIVVLEQDSVVGFRAKDTDPMVMVYERANGQLYVKLPTGNVHKLSRINENMDNFDVMNSVDTPEQSSDITIMNGEQSVTIPTDKAQQIIQLAFQLVQSNPGISQELADVINSCCGQQDGQIGGDVPPVTDPTLPPQ